METVVEVVLPGAKLIRPGEETFARLKLPQSALLLPGDRFIVRQFSPVVTIGGGVVLDAAPAARISGLRDFLPVLASGNRNSILRARVARQASKGISIARLVKETGWTNQVIESQLAGLEFEKHVVRNGDLWIHADIVSDLQLAILSVLGEFHKSHSLAAGISKEELHEKINASEGVFAAALDLMIRDKKIEGTGELVRLAGHRVVMKDDEAESKRHIEQVFAAAGLQVPALHDVMAGLKIEKARATKIVTLLLRETILVKISDELVFHRSALDQLRQQIARQKMIAPKMDVAGFKDLTGVSRKYAIPLLEYLDREHVTRRVGNVREIL